MVRIRDGPPNKCHTRDPSDILRTISECTGSKVKIPISGLPISCGTFSVGDFVGARYGKTQLDLLVSNSEHSHLLRNRRGLNTSTEWREAEFLKDWARVA
jgi:hypothetical protein